MKATDRRGEKQVVCHLMRVGPLAVAVTAAVISALAFLTVLLVSFISSVESPMKVRDLALAAIAGFVGTLITTSIFNFIAPMLGGLKLHLSLKPDNDHTFEH